MAARDGLRIHFLVPSEAGPVRSQGARVLLTAGGLRQQVGGGSFRAACDPGLVIGTEWDRGTDRWYGVHCAACCATEEYREAAEEPDPRAAPRPDTVRDEHLPPHKKALRDEALAGGGDAAGRVPPGEGRAEGSLPDAHPAPEAGAGEVPGLGLPGGDPTGGPRGDDRGNQR